MSLFNTDDFPSPSDPKEPKRKRAKRPALDQIDSDGHWHVIAQAVAGPIPFCHRLDPWHTVIESSVLTRCEQIGRLLYTPWLGQPIYPCPECRRITG